MQAERPEPADGADATGPIEQAGPVGHVDRHPFRAAAGLTLLLIAAGLLYSLWMMPAVTGAHRWWVLQDAWPPMLAARYASSGALGYLYAADRWFVGMPLGPIVLMPASLAGDALRLTDSYRFRVAHPSMWVLYEPYALALCGMVLVAGRSLMQAVWVRAGLFVKGTRPNHLWTQVGMAALVVVPAAIVSGHFETVWALACVLAAIRLALADRWRGAALWLGVAIGFDLWAALGVPLLVAIAPREERPRVLVRSLGVPAALLALPFAVDPSDTSRALLHPLSFPTTGHALPWIRRTSQPIGWGFGRALAFVPAAVLAWWVRGRREPRVVLAAFALIFLMRPLFEAVTFAFDLCPAFALLFLYERSRGRLGIPTVVLGSGLMASYLLHPDPLFWWATVLSVTTFIAWPAGREMLAVPKMPVGSTLPAAPRIAALEAHRI